MIVLSLFDGMSCAQIALKELGINVEKYYASEIDKHAIKVTQHNFPNTIQLGDVTKWREWDIDWSKIGFLAGGSPCQSFSFAGKRKGMSTKSNEEIHTLEKYIELKDNGFEFEGQSYLFWEYMSILKHIQQFNPNVIFLLENVEMGKKWEKVLSDAIGLKGVHINSALVSAQNRKRIYWSNVRVKQEGLFGGKITDIPQPKDKGILLRDILEDEVDEKYYLSEKSLKKIIKHGAIKHVYNEKSNCLLTGYHKMGGRDQQYIVASRGINPENLAGLPTEHMLEPRTDGKTNCLTSVHKDNLVLTLPEATKKGFAEIKPGECFDFENPSSKTRRGRKMTEKSNCLMAKETDFMQLTQTGRIRRLTPTECKRLQTVPDYIDMSVVSETQQYRMLGNGWNINTITHILSYMNL